jgi:hypothetical protein
LLVQVKVQFSGRSYADIKREIDIFFSLRLLMSLKRRNLMFLKIEDSFNILKKWKEKGFRKLDNGTEIICHVPNSGPEAWLHKIYAPLKSELIENLETRVVSKKLPLVFKEFLSSMNGLNLFSDTFNVYGVRFSYVRSGDESMQPYDLATTDSGRPKNCPKSWLYIGSYSWDGSKLVMDTSESEDPKVFRVERWNTKVIQEWDSFSEWLNNEMKRVEKLFDESGYEIDPDVPSV